VPGAGADDHLVAQWCRQELAGFRREFYRCLTGRADALFELTDALLCAPGPVTSLPELSLQAVHRRGHGAMYDALACGRLEVDRLRRCLAGCGFRAEVTGSCGSRWM